VVKLTIPERLYPHMLRRLYWPFLALAESCPQVVGTVAGSFVVDDRQYTLPRFQFLGPGPTARRMRVALFALVHGDEPAGALALRLFLERLVARPELAAGFDLFFYPVCNPTGYEDGTRHNRSDRDLNREFWRDSAEPEVRILEAELSQERFDGLVAVHADDTSDGVYGYAPGRRLNERLLTPALRASEAVLPLNRSWVIDGFPAAEGVVAECFDGVLSPPPWQEPRPFEVILETPARAPMTRQGEAACCALEALLFECRAFTEQGMNL